MHIRKKLYVHVIPLASDGVDISQLYYMGRTADEFARSPEPNGVQRESQATTMGFSQSQLTAAQT